MAKQTIILPGQPKPAPAIIFPGGTSTIPPAKPPPQNPPQRPPTPNA